MIKVQENMTSSLVLCYNGKFGGGRMLLSPAIIINDGYQEIYFSRNVLSVPEVFDCMASSKCTGYHQYNPKGDTHRFKKMRVENKSTVRNRFTGIEQNSPQDINIDGEDLIMNDFAKFEVLASELEIIVDFKRMF